MGHTYTNLMYHCIFSTKRRRSVLSCEVTERLVEYVGGVVRNRGGKLLAMDGPGDHVHLLASFAASGCVSDHLRDIKAGSSGWIHKTFPQIAGFGWQEGYAAFSVSKSQAPRIVNCIERQRQHHQELSFHEELIAILDRHGIDYDPKYIFE